MQRSRPGIWIYYAAALVVFAIDYASKRWIEHSVAIDEQIRVIGNFFVITSIRNRGAAFSILQDQRVFFIVITVAVAAAIVWYLRRSYHTGRTVMLIALSLVLGGAVGNFFDRAVYGEVVDFLQFNFGSYTFPVFNLADTAITIGVALILVDALLLSSQEKKGQAEHDERTNEESRV
ncbi:signal peptidase II [Cohnella zeiphila]|uniref:Lipoprotein signal peptidase n=1 Tax=Cohnella zeiphila TaxID=2761120 RepID=A0A7X0SGL5_9BACL|nr:signal peptidase II [Cohnella zeiphila]MBB6729601.1 signal peptidase II [Cohnella zeiphila]